MNNDLLVNHVVTQEELDKFPTMFEAGTEADSILACDEAFLKEIGISLYTVTEADTDLLDEGKTVGQVIEVPTSHDAGMTNPGATAPATDSAAVQPGPAPEQPGQTTTPAEEIKPEAEGNVNVGVQAPADAPELYELEEPTSFKGEPINGQVEKVKRGDVTYFKFQTATEGGDRVNYEVSETEFLANIKGI